MKFVTLWAIAFGCLIIDFNAVSAEFEASDIDVLRALHNDLEKESIHLFENGVDPANNLRQIFNEYGRFVESNLTKEFIGNNYIFLENFYEWKLLENDLISLNNLFSSFRTMLLKPFDSVERLELTDFAETVLNDKQFSVNETLEKIINIMVSQGVYYKISLVCVIITCFHL